MRIQNYFLIGVPISEKANFWLPVIAFILPLTLWSALSYLPFLWHPQVLIENPGDTYFRENDRVDKENFQEENRQVALDGQRKASGIRVNPIYLPAPHQVLKAIYVSFKTPPRRKGEKWLYQNVWDSIEVISLGFLLSSLVGIPLGILCGSFPVLSRLNEPFVDFVRYMPAPAFGPLAVAILGINDAPKIAIIFIGTFFQQVLVIANTTRQFDHTLIETAQTLGANRFALLTNVIVPGALPDLYRDMRILLGWAWTYLIVAEIIGAKSGISLFITQQAKYRNYDKVFAGIIIIGLIGFLTDQILGLIGRHIFIWEERE